jgi:hypothetical protein
MALTAVLTIDDSTVLINQPVNATVTITSTESSAVTIESVKPYAIFTGATAPMPASVAYGSVNLGPNSAATIAASGTGAFPFQVVFFAGSKGLYNTGSGTYDLSATCETTGGTIVASDTVTVSVSQLTFPTVP